jgi:hypothetical protein
MGKPWKTQLFSSTKNMGLSNFLAIALRFPNRHGYDTKIKTPSVRKKIVRPRIDPTATAPHGCDHPIPPKTQKNLDVTRKSFLS